MGAIGRKKLVPSVKLQMLKTSRILKLQKKKKISGAIDIGGRDWESSHGPSSYLTPKFSRTQ